MIKGGIWRNTEDEILKAAVMKYGKNQWSRIASLLHRKSAKQCKARWYEWLDPSIKKTEWSREEEEKLLHLAKLMPTQWRTIASIVGRTASQCLEHYEQLLDQATKKDDEAADDPRKLKPGEIDPNPETKPARPDPKDMDEDELEMLSEARARLANTQGKKAKRKAREKQLEEARRLATLQKRRELRMAGINVSINKRNRKKRGMDYNAEIPFHKPVPAGFHDVSGEEFVPPHHDYKSLRQQELDEEKRAEKEERERKKDKEKLKKRKENGLPPPLPFRKEERQRSKLSLPEPQVSDAELEQVVKLGRASEIAKDVVDSNELLGDYSVTSTPQAINSVRTPKTALSRDHILMEAQNLIALQNVETPLKGGVNTPLHEVQGFGQSVMTPNASSVNRALVTATPNPLLTTPFRTPSSSTQDDSLSVVLKTPGRGDGGVTNIATPLRDSLAINPESSLTFQDHQEEKLFTQDIKSQLKRKLGSLPAPKNEYEILLNDDAETTETIDDRSILQEDQADIDARREAEETVRLEAEMSRQSQAIQRNLPRPIKINESIMKSTGEHAPILTQLQKAEELVKEEMLTMLHHDALKNPTLEQMASKVSSSEHTNFLSRHPYFEATKEDLEEARQLILDEAANVKEKMGHGEILLDTFTSVWEECLSQVNVLPSDREGKAGDVVRLRENDPKRIPVLERRFDKNRGHMEAGEHKAKKLEKKLSVIHGGYQKRAESLIKQFSEIHDQIDQLRLQLATFRQLQRAEESAITKRISALQSDMCRQMSREKDLQSRYDNLIRRKQDLEKILLENRISSQLDGGERGGWVNISGGSSGEVANHPSRQNGQNMSDRN